MSILDSNGQPIAGTQEQGSIDLTAEQMRGLVFIAKKLHAHMGQTSKAYLAGLFPEDWDEAIKDDRFQRVMMGVVLDLVKGMLEVQGAGHLPFASMRYELAIRKNERDRCLQVLGKRHPQASAALQVLPLAPVPVQKEEAEAAG